MDAEPAPSLLRRASSRPNSLPKNRWAAQQRRQPDLTTALFIEGVLLAKSLFIVALCACPSSGLRRGVGQADTPLVQSAVHYLCLLFYPYAILR